MNASQVHVKVTNGNDFDIEDRFDGVPYPFKAGRTVTVPLEAAIHFFGFKVNPDTEQLSIEPDIEHVTRRWGWNTQDYIKDGLGKKIAAKITVAPVTYEMVERAGEDDAETDLPSPRASAARQGETEEEARVPARRRAREAEQA